MKTAEQGTNDHTDNTVKYSHVIIMFLTVIVTFI